MRYASTAPFALVLMVFLVSCARPAPADGSRAADEAAIRAGVARYETALNERDAAGVASLYTADGDLTYFDEARVAGADDIQRTLATSLAALPPGWRATLAVTGIRFVTSDAAILETTATFSEGPPNRGTAVLVRDGDEWRYAALRIFPGEGSR